MSYDDFHKLERQAAFWRNAVYDFEQLIKNFKNRLPEKWVVSEDVDSITHVLENLKFGVKVCLYRYRDVIDSQLECLDSFTVTKLEDDEVKEEVKEEVDF